MEYVYLSQTYWYRSVLFVPKCLHACAHFTNEYVTINIIIRRATLNLTIKTRKCVCVCVSSMLTPLRRGTHTQGDEVCARGARVYTHTILGPAEATQPASLSQNTHPLC